MLKPMTQDMIDKMKEADMMAKVWKLNHERNIRLNEEKAMYKTDTK